MSMAEYIALAFALAADALAVAIALGLCPGEDKLKTALRIALFFGIAQALMALLGVLLGGLASGPLASAASWVAAALLWAIALHMIYDSFNEEDQKQKDACALPRLTLLALATSIDALGAGAGMALVDVDVTNAVIAIGLCAAILPGGGYLLARRLSAKGGHRLAKFSMGAGALILVVIGVKILVA